METSAAPSSLPPNHAATTPCGVSAMVEAWTLGIGAAV
jgi:hypothetical protein